MKGCEMRRVLMTWWLFSSVLLANVQKPSDVLELYVKENLEQVDIEQLQAYCDKALKNIDLSKAQHRAIIEKTEEGGGIAVWFLKAKSGSTVVVNAEKNRAWPMRELGQSGLYFSAEKFPPMSSVHFRYTVNGSRFPMGKEHRFGFENYSFGEMSLKQDHVPEGKLIKMPKHQASDEFFKGAIRDWWVYVPAQYQKDEPAKLMVFNDGSSFAMGEGNACIVLDNLIHAKKLPVMIAVFINPGEIPNQDLKKPAYKNRSDEYDTCTATYANFLEKEILAQVYAEYNVSKRAEDHAIGGSSSGASCAFSAAWYRNDLFTRVLSFVGSYTDFRRIGDFPQDEGEKSKYGPWKVAHDYPSLIRKTEPKRSIRVYLQDGENDLDNNLGNWFLNNLRMEAALKFSGYEVNTVWGKGMHSKKHGMSVLPEMLEWLWQ